MQKVWIDLFEMPDLRGRCRRLLGPGIYDNLHQVNIPLRMVIESLAAGPQTYVRLYDAEHPSETIWWMRPNTIIASLDRLSNGRRVDSMALTGDPPKPRDLGYEFFKAFGEAKSDGH